MPPLVFRFPIPESQLYDVGNWHSFYFFQAFFEAREALFESFEVTQEKIKEEGFAIVISELHSKYWKSFLKGDVALIEISLVELGETHMIFFYRVRKEGDASLKTRAEGITVQVLIDRDKRDKVSLPSWIREPLLKIDKASWPKWLNNGK